jgi:hypothetical protein
MLSQNETVPEPLWAAWCGSLGRFVFCSPWFLSMYSVPLSIDSLCVYSITELFRRNVDRLQSSLQHSDRGT